MTAAFAIAEALGYAPTPAKDPRGPWCPNCGHEFRTRDGKPELAGLFPQASCPYCRAMIAPVPVKPFHEISKSELEKFSPELDPSKGCKLRWYFEKLLDIQVEKNPYAALGIRGHELAEDWLKHKRLPVINSMEPKSPDTIVGTALLGGIPHAPTADAPGLEVEREFHFEFEGVRYMGYKDFSSAVSAEWPGSPFSKGMAGDAPGVGDWKFTSDLKWALTPEALAKDVQAIIYGWDEIERWRAAQAWLSWVYMERGSRNARPVRTFVYRDHLRDGMRRLNSIAREILYYRERHARGELTARDVPANPSACKAFGKMCPHIERCHVTPEQRFAAEMEKAMASAFDAIMAAQNGAPAPAPAAPAAFVPPPAPAAQAPAFVPQVGVTPPPLAPAAPTQPTLVKMEFPGGQVFDVPSDQVAQYAQTHGAKVASAATTPATSPPVAPSAPVAQSVQQAPATAPAPGRPPGTRRRGPKPATQSAPPAHAPGAAQTPAPSIVNTTGETVNEGPAGAKLGFTLCINCQFDVLPAGKRLLFARDLIAVAAKEVCNDQQVPHYSMVADGQGPALLAVYLDGLARDGLLGLDGNTVVFIDANVLESQHVSMTLENLAAVVIRKS